MYGAAAQLKLLALMLTLVMALECARLQIVS